MASNNDKEVWSPERTENILSTEPNTASTGDVGTTSTTSSTQAFKDTRNNGPEAPDVDHYGSIVKDEDERPRLQHTRTSSTAGELDDEKDLRIRRTQTSRSTRERRFTPIRAGDAMELTRLATELEDGGSVQRTSTVGSALQRRDTLAGINLEDAVLDPKSPEFNPYVWVRMWVNAISDF